MDKILLIDGLNFIYRSSVSFFATNTNSNKENSSQEDLIVFNFFRSLRKIIEDLSPDKIFFCLEGKPKFRYDLFPDYKANRKIIKTASQENNKEKVFLAKSKILSLLKFLPLTLVKAEEYECDDVISTLVDNLKDEDITIISNDSDYLQILQKGYSKVKIFNPFKSVYMTAPAYHYVAWKSLAGDKSDNIPGLVGKKTAEKLLTAPDKLEKFLSIEENRSLFSINKKLIEFAKIPEDKLLFEEGFANFDRLKEEFILLKFESIINDKSWNKFINTFKNVKF